MDFLVQAATGPWLPVAVSGILLLLGLGTASSARAAARQARAATESAERTLASLVELHRGTERLQAALRESVAGGGVVAAGASAGPAAGAPAAGAAAAIPPASAPDSASTPASASAPAGGADEGEETVMLSRKVLQPQLKDQFHGLPVLRVLAGPDLGREFRLAFERCTIGRASTNRVVIAEEKASRIHAEVRFDQHRFFVRDTGSTNGTLRNGAALTDSELEFGDVLAIGATQLLFTCEGFEAKNEDAARSMAAFERMLEREGDFVPALQNLAFLMERDPARRREAEGVWKRLNKLG